MVRTKNGSRATNPNNSSMTPPEAIINQSQSTKRKRPQVQTKRSSKRLETLPPSESMVKKALSFPSKTLKDRYDMISKRDILRGRSIHNETLDALGIRKKVDDLIDRIGWKSFFEINCPTFVELTREFYTTFSFDNSGNIDAHTPGVVRYRLMWHNYEESITDFNKSLGYISEKDVHEAWYINSKIGYGNWSCIDAWKNMSLDQLNYDPSQSSGAMLKEPEWQYIHRFLSYNFVARKSGSGTCSKLELHFLWAMVNGVRVNLGYWLADAFRKVIEKNKGLIFGHVITHLAVRHRLVDLENHSLHIVHDNMIPLDLNTLKRMGIIEENGGAYRFRNSKPLPAKEHKQSRSVNLLDEAEDLACNFTDVIDMIDQLGIDLLGKVDRICKDMMEKVDTNIKVLSDKVDEIAKVQSELNSLLAAQKSHSAPSNLSSLVPSFDKFIIDGA